MYPGFVKQVAEVCDLIRKGDMLKLGRHSLTQLVVVRKRVGHGTAVTDLHLGRTLRDLVTEIVESQMRPGGEERLDRIDWRKYLILKKNVILDEPWVAVAKDLVISQATFFETKREAIEHLAMELWGLEQAAMMKPETTHNLPRREREFVPRADNDGRDYVLKIIDQLRTQRPHLVSIRGIGGAGKTTLALEVAYRCAEAEYYDMVIWTTAQEKRLELTGDLTPIAERIGSTDGILDAVGKTFGERKVLTLDRDEKQQVVKSLLASRDCLLIIDSTEDLSDEANKEILAFVREAPYPTKVLLTSRARVSEDRLELVNTLGGMRQNEALQFMRNECEPRGITWISEEGMLDIDRVTDGLPLAMLIVLGEMAATGRSSREVVEMTSARGEALLKYLFEKGYQDLDSTAKKTLYVMSTFVAPVLPDIISIAVGVESFHILDALASLHTRFLVTRGPEERYTCPETVKTYIRKMGLVAKVDDQPATEFIGSACQRLAREYSQRLRNQQGLAFLKEQQLNVLAMMEWCFENDKWQMLIDLMSALGRPLGTLGYWNERIKWGQLSIRACRQLDDRSSEAWFAIHDIAWTYLLKGEREAGKRWIKEGLNLAREVGNRKAEALGLRNLAWIAYRMDEDPKEASRYAQESLALWEELEEEDLNGITMAKSVLGKAKYKLGRMSGDQELLVQARDLLSEVLKTREALDEVEEVAEALSDLALVALAEKDGAKAKRLSNESTIKAQQLPEPAESLACALKCRGEIEKELGELEEARYYFKESLSIYDKLGAGWAIEHIRRKLQEMEQAEQTAPAPQTQES